MAAGHRRARPARALLLSAPVALALVVLGAVGIVVVRSGGLSREPWLYVSFAVAGLGAVSAMLLAIVRSNEVS